MWCVGDDAGKHSGSPARAPGRDLTHVVREPKEHHLVVRTSDARPHRRAVSAPSTTGCNLVTTAPARAASASPAAPIEGRHVRLRPGLSLLLLVLVLGADDTP